MTMLETVSCNMRDVVCSEEPSEDGSRLFELAQEVDALVRKLEAYRNGEVA